MKTKVLKLKYIFLAFTAIAAFFQSCNEKEDPNSTPSIQNVASVAITSFSVKQNGVTNSALDSIYFAVDLRNGVIFNSDSLPKGTDITKLTPVIEFDQGVSEVLITMEGGTHREGTSNLRQNPSDTIDFTGKVTIDVKPENGDFTFQYLVKVNVHKEVPDTMMWNNIETADFPSRLSNPVDQKTVRFGSDIISLIEEKDGSFTLAKSDTIDITAWQKQALNLEFSPALRSLTATGQALYMLDAAGNLFSSADCITWQSTGMTWTYIIGAYGDRILGIKEADGKLIHTAYPAGSGLSETPIEADFPISGTTNFVTFANIWTVEPIGLLTGGIDGAGRYSTATWGFDGNVWAKISENSLPAITDATLVPYEAYKKVPKQSKYDQFKIWLLMGGKLADGSINRKVYFSFDNGVNWVLAPESMQLPEELSSVVQADNVVLYDSLQGSIAGWKKVPMKNRLPKQRLGYDVVNDIVTWECPYIYIYGGKNAEGKLSTKIWRGVINRLRLIPQV